MDVAKIKTMLGTDAMLDTAEDLINQCKYKEVLDLFCKPLSWTAEQECRLLKCMSQANRMLGYLLEALEWAKEYLKNTKRLWKRDSVQYVCALHEMASVALAMHNITEADAFIEQAFKILNKLGMQDSVIYSAVRLVQCELLRTQGLFQAALATYLVVWQRLQNSKGCVNYIHAIEGIAYCHYELEIYDEALRFYHELVEISTDKSKPIVLISMSVMARIYRNLRQFDIALAYMETVRVMYRETLGSDHEKTIELTQKIQQCRAEQYTRPTGKRFPYRMCNYCNKISKTPLQKCPCLRAYYCNADCQTKDWLIHRPNCIRCCGCDEIFVSELGTRKWFHCPTCYVMKYCSAKCRDAHVDHPDCTPHCFVCHIKVDVAKKCSRCLATTYCSEVCQKLDWSIHKAECKK